MAIQLVDNASSWHKFWSVRLGALGTLITTIFTLWPDSVYTVWQSLPPDIQSLMPQKYFQLIGAFIFLMSMIARIVKQNNIGDQSGSSTETKENIS